MNTLLPELDCPDWKKWWDLTGMPEYSQLDQTPKFSVTALFATIYDREDFQRMVGEIFKTNTDKTSNWMNWPPTPYRKWTNRNEKASNVGGSRYTIYIVSKGRWKQRMTARNLDEMGIPYYIVVEPQEYEKYAAVIDPKKILQLPKANYGGGCSIPARNWIWEHSIKSGAKRHWILDDNIGGFFELNNNEKPKVKHYNPFQLVEKFVDQFENVGIAGMNYEFFVQVKQAHPPYVLNTRVYSCILIRNDLPFRWRGRYNEDTDLSLRVLKAGIPTVLFNYVVAKKQTTMTATGGNTESLYEATDGRLKMAVSLCEQHPDVSKITWKWGRWQHHVDYRRFKRIRLIPREEII